ncbi:MAG TPA: hypothetical protein PKH77_05055 [Anaerolineae bacterium]|nr:hypothetical protein [Anaerolineae bacterium]
MTFEERTEQMALALALSNYGAEGLGDQAQTAQGAWSLMMMGLMECGHGERESEMLLDAEVKGWLHDIEGADPYVLKSGAQLLERFAWGG